MAFQIRKRQPTEPMSEADARKQKIALPKVLKLKVTGAETIDLLNVQRDSTQEPSSKKRPR